MAARSEFIDGLDAKVWRHVLSLYSITMKEKASKKSKPGASADLLLLDSWYQNTLPQQIQGRDVPFITQQELVKLMTWKLARGKFRPRLIELAGSNSSDDVETLSKKAFALVKQKKQLKGAIALLSKLKGIGPATASAVLAASCPEHAAFMADEPTVCLLRTSSLKYNMAEYLAYMDKVSDCVDALKEQDPEYGWNAHQVELAVWTHVVAGQLGVDVNKKTKEGSECSAHKSSKRSRDTPNGSDSIVTKNKKKKA